MAGPNINRGGCFLCMRILKWLPVLFIVIIILWSYYAYVIEYCTISIDSKLKKITYLTFYHIICIMLGWSYWQTIFTYIGRVPANFKISDADFQTLAATETIEQQREMLENIARHLPITNINIQGIPRFCEKCRIIKPDRSHHCSVCRECVLKMDHHCPWINNCVCFTNYKFFILFLGYALTYCFFISLTTLEYLIDFCRGNLKNSPRFQILFVFCVAIMFGLSIVSLFGYHIYLISQNRTTIEAFRPPIFRSGPDKRGFSLGRYNNFQEVFGDNLKTWFLPIATSLGDGTTFPQRHMEEASEGLLNNYRLDVETPYYTA